MAYAATSAAGHVQYDGGAHKRECCNRTLSNGGLIDQPIRNDVMQRLRKNTYRFVYAHYFRHQK